MLATPISTSTWDCLGLVGDGDRARHLREAAVDLGDHEVPADQLDGAAGAFFASRSPARRLRSGHPRTSSRQMDSDLGEYVRDWDAAPPTRARPPWTSGYPPSGTPFSCVAGTPTSPPAPKETRRPSPSRSPILT